MKRIPNTVTEIPNKQELLNLPLAESGSYMLTEKQIATLRRRLYNLNADNVRGWRWRSTKTYAGKGMYNLLVWRFG
jgi:hypothetical protein